MAFSPYFFLYEMKGRKLQALKMQWFNVCLRLIKNTVVPNKMYVGFSESKLNMHSDGHTT